MIFLVTFQFWPRVPFQLMYNTSPIHLKVLFLFFISLKAPSLKNGLMIPLDAWQILLTFFLLIIASETALNKKETTVSYQEISKYPAAFLRIPRVPTCYWPLILQISTLLCLLSIHNGILSRDIILIDCLFRCIILPYLMRCCIIRCVCGMLIWKKSFGMEIISE